MPAIDWANLRFGYSDTDYNVRCRFENGKWGEIEVSTSPTIELHMAASSLHYGQEVFEGLKAFRGRDGKIRVFRLEENARRIIESAKGAHHGTDPRRAVHRNDKEGGKAQRTLRPSLRKRCIPLYPSP